MKNLVKFLSLVFTGVLFLQTTQLRAEVEITSGDISRLQSEANSSLEVVASNIQKTIEKGTYEGNDDKFIEDFNQSLERLFEKARNELASKSDFAVEKEYNQIRKAALSSGNAQMLELFRALDSSEKSTREKLASLIAESNKDAILGVVTDLMVEKGSATKVLQFFVDDLNTKRAPRFPKTTKDRAWTLVGSIGAAGIGAVAVATNPVGSSYAAVGFIGIALFGGLSGLLIADWVFDFLPGDVVSAAATATP